MHMPHVTVLRENPIHVLSIPKTVWPFFFFLAFLCGFHFHVPSCPYLLSFSLYNFPLAFLFLPSWFLPPSIQRLDQKRGRGLELKMGMGSHGHDQGSSWQMVKMMVMEELLKGQDSTTRLQALLQFEETPLLENSSGGNPMMELVVEVIETLSRAISLLGKETTAEAPLAQASSDEQKSEISGMKRKTQTPRRSGYRRRSHPYICRTVIAKEIEDGYTWRKYGQKIIYGTTHQRSYYRCSHKFDRDCQATRQVQKTEDASMFNIIYMGEHTCMAATELAAPCIISFKSGDTANTHQEAPLSSVPILPPIKLECDEEVLSNHSPRSGSTELVVLPDFSDFEGSAPVAHFMGIASDQYDVTSSIRYSTSTLDMEFYPEAFKLDDMLDFSEVQYIN